MFLWDRQLPLKPESQISLPPIMLPWRCANCGAEGTLPKGSSASETMRQVEIAHGRVAPECWMPRFLAVTNGRAVEVRV